MTDYADRARSWSSVPGFRGVYEVSSDGQVRSLGRIVRRGSGRAFAPGAVLSQMIDSAGRPRVNLSHEGRTVNRRVSVLVAGAFLGPRPIGGHVCHRNGDPADNRVDNLYYGSPSENAQDRVRHGRDSNGRKTHCKNGHEFTEENTYAWEGARYCRACRAQRSRELRDSG